MKLKHLSLAVMTLGAVASGAAHAAGYQFGSQSVSAQGTAFANGAEADDATTIFYNPAGMSHLKGNHISGGLTLVLPHSTFESNGSTNFLGASTGNNNGGDYAPSSVVAPSLYMTHQINDKLTAGLGFFVPYGSKLGYDNNWAGRYSLQSISLKTLDINPSLSFKLNEKSSIGFGVSAQYMSAKLTQAADSKTGAALAVYSQTGFAPGTAVNNFAISGINGDGQGRVSGDDWGYGWNIGYMYELSDATRFGLAYRSSVKHKLDGDFTWDFSNITGSLNGIPMALIARSLHPNSKATVDVETPETISANVFHQLNDKIGLMGDVTWTRNSRMQEIRIQQSTVNGVQQGDLVIHQNWRDTYRVSVGMNYQLTDAFMLRAGLGYDQSPVHNDQDRHPALPDSDRTLYSLGANYKLTKNSSIDMAYTYMHFKDAVMDYTDTCNPAISTVCTGNGETTKGSYKTYIQMLGLQYNYAF